MSSLKLITPNEPAPNVAELMKAAFERYDGDYYIIDTLESLMIILNLRTVEDVASYLGQYPDRASRLVSTKTVNAISDYLSSKVF